MTLKMFLVDIFTQTLSDSILVEKYCGRTLMVLTHDTALEHYFVFGPCSVWMVYHYDQEEFVEIWAEN